MTKKSVTIKKGIVLLARGNSLGGFTEPLVTSKAVPFLLVQ
jgi:hypothetical protein